MRTLERKILIDLLKEVIEDYEKEINQASEESTASIEEYKNLVEMLEKDPSSLANVEKTKIEEIISSRKLEEEEKKKYLSYLATIRTLLSLNKTKKTTFQITNVQSKYLKEFIEMTRQVQEEKKRESAKSLEKIAKICTKLRKYKKLLGILEDEKNPSFMEEIDTLRELLEEKELEEEVKRKILLGVLRYNKEIFEKREERKNTPQRERLNVEEVKQIFDTYRYDFQKLSEKSKEELLDYGNLENIRGVFRILKDLHYPPLDFKREERKLVMLLLYSNPKTIEEVTKYSIEKGLYPKDLVSLLPALITQQKKDRELKEEKKVDAASFSTPTGRSEDYEKNVEFLERIGLSPRYVYQKCRELLIFSNKRLVSNYKKMLKYGFSITEETSGELTHPALSCLIAPNFEEIVDQFIELGSKTQQYIKENMSRILTISSPDDLVFYNIYASYQEENEWGEKLSPEGPFTNDGRRRLSLRGEITRYPGSGYENTPYRGITEENKKEKTMTITPTFENKERLEEAIALRKKEEQSEVEYLDERLERLEEYRDPQNPYRYNIDGVIISRPKVKRIFSILKDSGLGDYENSLLYAITYHTILSQESYDKIKNAIKDRRK